MDDDWRLRTERELGGVQARLHGVESADAALRAEMRNGFDKQERALADGTRQIGESVLRESAHTRGEIARLDALYQENRRNDEAAAQQRRRDEEQRNAELIATLKRQASEAEAATAQAAKDAANKNRPFFAVIVLIGLALQWLVQNAPSISSAMETFSR